MVAPRGPNKSFGFGEMRIGVASHGNADCSRRMFRSGNHRHTAGRTEFGFKPAPGIDIPPPDPSLAGNRHRCIRKDRAVAEGAAAFPLTVQAAASMDLGGLPTCRDRKIAAAATARSLGHTLCPYLLIHYGRATPAGSDKASAAISAARREASWERKNSSSCGGATAVWDSRS